MLDTEIKLCQSCIERGIIPANPATREWQKDIFWCEECFQAAIQNLTNIGHGKAQAISEDNKKNGIKAGPVLDKIYDALAIPEELRFDKVDTVCRNYDKIFNFHAPAVVNRTLEDLAVEVEELSMSLFHIKYRIEPLEMQIKKLKEQRREEKNLKSYDDSKEEYAKNKGSKVKATQEEKMAKVLGMSLEQYREFQKKAREKEFNKIAGNCPECGGSLPCAVHSKK